MAGDPIEILVIVGMGENLAIIEIETEITVVEIIETEIITITTETEIMIEKEIEIMTETETEISTVIEIMDEGDIQDVVDTVLHITQNFVYLSQVYHKDVHGKI